MRQETPAVWWGIVPWIVLIAVSHYLHLSTPNISLWRHAATMNDDFTEYVMGHAQLHWIKAVKRCRTQMPEVWHHSL